MSARARPRLLVIVGHYPSIYKPYYDTQFIDLIEAGVDLAIAAAPPLDEIDAEHLRVKGVLQRVRFYPMSAREAGKLALWRVLATPRRLIGLLRSGRRSSLRKIAGDLLRAGALPHGKAPVLIHSLIVATRFHWLPRWLNDVPIAVYYHGGEVPSVPDQPAEAVAQAFRNCDLVFTNTEFSKQQAIDRGCPADIVRVLPVGFDLAQYPDTPRAYRRGDRLNLLSVGRLSEEKGLQFAIEALRQVVESGRTNIHYSIIGEGYYRTEIERAVIAYGLGRHVSFLGALPYASVIEQMGIADALLLPSVPLGNWAETQACVVQEAMLMKALAVTSRMGGVPESIPAELTPFSFPPGDSVALAGVIMRTYDMQPDELAAWGETGRSFVQSHYDITVLNRRLLSELEQVAVRRN